MGHDSKEPLHVVKNVNLQLYQGHWYEIGSIPSRFQPRAGKNTTATYTLKPDGTVHVLNETWQDGKRASIEGTAWKADSATEDAKFKVRFWVPPFLPLIPVTGNYWVMQLDEEYRWVLVGEPYRQSLWVLSRTPQLDEEIYSKLLAHAEKEGYDVSRIHKTQHDETSEAAASGSGQEVHNDKGTWWLKSLLGK